MIKIEVNNQIKVPYHAKALFTKVSRLVWQQLKLKKSINLSVALVSVKIIKGLNKRYRGKNKITDVLAFPELNEIIICYPQACRQAKQQKQNVNQQLAWLFCHGLLHLLGFDHHHKGQEQVMRGLEMSVLNKV